MNTNKLAEESSEKFVLKPFDSEEHQVIGVFDSQGHELVSICESDKRKIVKRPRFNGAYYSISSTGEIEKSTWKNDAGDQFRLKTGNVFLKEEDAEHRAKELFK